MTDRHVKRPPHGSLATTGAATTDSAELRIKEDRETNVLVAVGERGVEAPGNEQLVLPVGHRGRVQPFDLADEEAGGGAVLLRFAGERGVLDLGDLGVGYSAFRRCRRCNRAGEHRRGQRHHRRQPTMGHDIRLIERRECRRRGKGGLHFRNV